VSVDIDLAKRLARKRSAQIRYVGELYSHDVVVLENRLSGERRRVPMKHYMMAAKDNAVAFELGAPHPAFEDERPTEPDDE